MLGPTFLTTGHADRPRNSAHRSRCWWSCLPSASAEQPQFGENALTVNEVSQGSPKSIHKHVAALAYNDYNVKNPPSKSVKQMMILPCQPCLWLPTAQRWSALLRITALRGGDRLPGIKGIYKQKGTPRAIIYLQHNYFICKHAVVRGEGGVQSTSWMAKTV